uniref:Uncharacterized protein n=1 Tax=Myotis myotis TaxID=51298 RepID=A0A7J7Y0Q4_MYOMY|nr:hypothetical protein mMyoMyo1_011359 [Myotis myotis]
MPSVFLSHLCIEDYLLERCYGGIFQSFSRPYLPMDQSCSYSCLSGIQAQPLVITGIRFLLSEVPGLIMHVLEESIPEERMVSCICLWLSLCLCVCTPNFSLCPMYSLENDRYTIKFAQPYYQLLQQVQRSVCSAY